MGKQNTSVGQNSLDLVSAKVSKLFKGVELSVKTEAVVHYLYKRKNLHFSLTEAEEEELFSVLNKVLEPKEAFVMLREYIEQYGVKSSEAKKIFANLKRSFEVSLNFKEAELMANSEELPDCLTTFTPPSNNMPENAIVSDEELQSIVKEVEAEIENSN
ncbi:MAG: hypothetical protein IKW58_03175 [Alphaproteobacteria bacterium]|nr:hypothetical protein [Alphaproteobacteria bacterium]